MVSGVKCYYCSACINICPTNAIDFMRDDGYFKRMKINNEKCIGCGKCDDVCPVNKKHILNRPMKYLAGYSKNEKQNKKSASGGVASELSRVFLERKGYVCGVAWDDDLKGAHHQIIHSIEGLDDLDGVKYVQSEKNSCFSKIKKLLDDGADVLFIGVPCEVAGLKCFLKDENDRLVTVDLVCQGTTTDEVLKQFVERESKGRTVKGLDLRYQDFFHRDPEFFFLNLNLENRIRKNSFFYTDYGFAFFKYKRPECFECQFKGGSYADLTLGDCWGIDGRYPCYSQYGTSIILCNTSKGLETIDAVESLNLWEVDSDILQGNRRYKSPIVRDSDYEEFKRFFIDLGLHEAVVRLRKTGLKQIISQRIPWIIKKKIFGKGKQVIPYEKGKQYKRLR